MERWLVLAVLGSTWSSALGALLKGVVLENRSGRPMAHVVLTLDALEGGSTRRVGETTSDRAGGFAFPVLPAGHYLLRAAKAYYAEARYGQTRKTGPGRPIALENDGNFFAEVRMWRLGAITGTVYDPNRMGVPEQSVVLYSSPPPLRIVATARTDDRGVFRLAGLPPGQYVLRSAASELPGGYSVMPTFYPEFRELTDARRVLVDLDQEWTDADVTPLPGRLFRLSGLIGGCEPPASARITLSSDTGRRETTAACPGTFGFEGLSPGFYQLFAEVPDASLFAFRELFADRETESAGLQLRPPGPVQCELRLPEMRRRIGKDLRILVRRKDLAGPHDEQEVRSEHLKLAPGPWEFAILPPPGHWVEPMPEWQHLPTRAAPSGDWFELYVRESPQATFLRALVRPNAASIQGAVTQAAGRPVPFAPVYLLPATAPLRRATHGIRSAQCDEQGRYRFAELPPGTFLLASSYDLERIDPDTMAEARAASVVLKEGASATQDLPLYAPGP